MTGRAEAARDFNPTSEPHREDPFAFFSWARDSAPVTYVPALGAWLVSRYEDVVRVLEDTDLFSSRNALADIERDNPPEVLRILSGTLPVTRAIVQVDPPEPNALPRKGMSTSTGTCWICWSGVASSPPVTC